MTSHHYNIETADVVGTDSLGASTTLTILRQIRTVPGDHPVAPSPWRVRRAQPGLSLPLIEASDTAAINASNEAPQ